jgi:2-isopropylmalate synthase
MSNDNRVLIFDTTMRDGEQSPGASMNREEKIRIAKVLEEMGVDVIEAGFAIASQGDFDAVEAVAKEIKESTVCSLARAGRADIDRAGEALRPAARKRIHTFIATSPLHMRVKLQMEPDAVYQAVIDSVTRARKYTDDVEWSGEDATRSDHDFLCRCVEAPSLNGLGERAGNAAMEEIVMALRTRKDHMPYSTNIRTEMITRASHIVSTITGFVVQPNKAIVGANAFAHEAGIHQDGMLKDANTYEIMTPESVGLRKSNLVMGKHSGRHAFRQKLEDLGYVLGDNAVNDAFKRFKDLADKKKDVYDEDIVALVDDTVMRENDRIKFISLEVVCGTKVAKQTADLELEIDGVVRQTKAIGDGPVDATFNAIKQLTTNTQHLQIYQVHAVTGGTDAQAEVTVRLEENGKTVMGQGADADTLVASARAYINALNKLLVKREKTAPAALSA